MNSLAALGVERAIHRCHFVIFIALALSPSAGCVEIDGGAVELSWDIRTNGGDQAGCNASAPPIESIRLCWSGVTDAGSTAAECDSSHSSDFACGDLHGVTGFVIADGPWALSIQPICEGGVEAVAGEYQVPPPIVRNIRRGEVATLDALLVEVSPSRVCAP